MKLYKILFFALFILNNDLLSQNFQELQKLQDEYKKALDRQALQKPFEISEAEKTAKSTALPDKLIYSRKDIESLLVNTQKLLQRLDFFEDSIRRMPYVGYDFFTKRDSIPFWQNLPITKKYLLGPADEVIISLWGESNSHNIEIINRDGQIFIEKIGVLNLGGKSIDEAKKYITAKYSRVYSTLAGQSPKSFIDLTLGELKSVNVHFVGFVNIPGVHTVHPFSNVITGLIQAGGVDIKGTLRDIKLVRNNQIINSTDLYNYLISGEPLDDFRLMDQDIIYVPSRRSTIPITGRVLRPGYYELSEDENLKNLIKFTGGIDRFASNYIFLYKSEKKGSGGFLVPKTDFSKVYVAQGDSIHIPIEPDFHNFVEIQGQVKNPGKYPFNEKIKLTELIMATMSFNDNDFSQTMDLTSINIFRKNKSGQSPNKIVVDIKENIVLKNGDYINIPKKSYFKPIETVIITGEIKIPGKYPVNNLTTLTDILTLSGGYTDFALKDGIEIYRDSVMIAWEKENFILNDGDSLNVLKKTGLVFVGGEVNVPGYVSYRKNDSIKKYIQRTGGFTAFAEKNNIYVIHPNGNSKPVSSWPYPKVKEGSKIIVSQRAISGKEEVSGWQAFSAVSSQAGNIATTLLSLSLLINNQSSSGN